MNDPQLTDLFREQLRDETRTAPGFDELWSKAAVRHRSARVKKFAAALFVIGCIGAAVLALAKKEQPATEQRVVAALEKPAISAEQNIIAAPPKAVAPAEQPYVPEPENPVVQRPPDSGWERLDELNASIRFLHNRNEADSKRAQVLEALNQPDEASKLRASISKRTAELDESRKAAAELAKTVTGPVKKAGEAILPGENLEIHVQEDDHTTVDTLSGAVDTLSCRVSGAFRLQERLRPKRRRTSAMRCASPNSRRPP